MEGAVQTFSEQMHMLSDQLNSFDFTTTASRKGAAPSVCLRYYLFIFFKGECTRVSLCVRAQCTDPEFLPAGNQRSRVFSPPPTDESREEEAVHHLTVHSFTCRGRRKTESE